MITTLENDSAENQIAYSELCRHVGVCELVLAKNMKINHCMGCNDCWIVTPGICSIHDDYEQIFIKMLQSDVVVFLTEAHMGFVCSRMKNMIDRILPLVTMHLKCQDGQMRHYSRYNKTPDMSMLYVGAADHDYLNLWLERVQLNLHGVSLGAFAFDDREECYHALAHH